MFRSLLGVSLTIALIGATYPLYGGYPLDYDRVFDVSLPCALLWTALFAFGLGRFGKRGLWMLLGCPLALWWNVQLIIVGVIYSNR
jgi:hypothetical protein